MYDGGLGDGEGEVDDGCGGGGDNGNGSINGSGELLWLKNHIKTKLNTFMACKS